MVGNEPFALVKAVEEASCLRGRGATKIVEEPVACGVLVEVGGESNAVQGAGLVNTGVCEADTFLVRLAAF